MEKIRKYWGGVNMTWAKVILLAFITGAYTGLIKLVPFLDNTSFQDIAVYVECWILFALFIIVNCSKWWEASLKCFVFFLISQPLVYLIQVPFYDRGWAIFDYYGRWFKFTLLTLPGAAIAFQVKRRNWLSALVLAVATIYLAIQSVIYFRNVMLYFPVPRHLLSAVFCIALAVFLIFVLLDGKYRYPVLAATLAALIAFAVITQPKTEDKIKTIPLEGEGWTYVSEDASVADVEIGEEGAVVTAKEDGFTAVTFRNADGVEKEYYVSVTNGTVWISEIIDD